MKSTKLMGSFTTSNNLSPAPKSRALLRVRVGKKLWDKMKWQLTKECLCPLHISQFLPEPLLHHSVYIGQLWFLRALSTEHATALKNWWCTNISSSKGELISSHGAYNIGLLVPLTWVSMLEISIISPSNLISTVQSGRQAVKLVHSGASTSHESAKHQVT